MCRLRIATWNLQTDAFHPFPPHADAFRSAVAEVNADIWVITEAVLRFAPGDDYWLVASSRVAADVVAPLVPDRRWVAIWVRSGLNARRLEVYSEPDRMACIRLEQPGQRDVVIVGTVLPWRSDQRRSPRTGADAFCDSLHAQAEEWARLWGNPRACAFCVAGDFNQEFIHPLLAGTADGLGCLHAELGQLGLHCLTGNLLVQYPPAAAEQHDIPVIDHICVGGNLQPCPPVPLAGTWPIPGLADPPGPIADHYGAYADLEILP